MKKNASFWLGLSSLILIVSLCASNDLWYQTNQNRQRTIEAQQQTIQNQEFHLNAFREHFEGTDRDLEQMKHERDQWRELALDFAKRQGFPPLFPQPQPRIH